MSKITSTALYYIEFYHSFSCQSLFDILILSPSMPTSSFVSKSNSSLEKKSASPSSCHKGIDFDIVSRDNNPNGKIVLDDNIEQKSATHSICRKGDD